jgi:hypothetical protein
MPDPLFLLLLLLFDAVLVVFVPARFRESNQNIVCVRNTAKQKAETRDNREEQNLFPSSTREQWAAACQQPGEI